jgi:hypothetical protein
MACGHPLVGSALAGLEIRPRRAGENKPDLSPPQIALIGDVFEPVEICHRGVVEQHVDPPILAQGGIGQRRTLGRFGQMARLKGDHRSALGANHFKRSSSRGDVHVATDNRRTLERMPMHLAKIPVDR